MQTACEETLVNIANKTGNTCGLIEFRGWGKGQGRCVSDGLQNAVVDNAIVEHKKRHASVPNTEHQLQKESARRQI